MISMMILLILPDNLEVNVIGDISYFITFESNANALGGKMQRNKRFRNKITQLLFLFNGKKI